MTVGELQEILRAERETEEVHIKLAENGADYAIVAVSVRRTVSEGDPAPVVLVARRQEARG